MATVRRIQGILAGVACIVSCIITSDVSERERRLFNFPLQTQPQHRDPAINTTPTAAPSIDAAAEANILNRLRSIQTQVNADYDAARWKVHADGTSSFTKLIDAFLKGTLDYLKGHNPPPVFIYDAPTHTDSYIGNRLGNYFEAVACADIAGLHFVCLTNQTDANKLAQGLPTVRVHPSPAATLDIAKDNVRTKCTLENPFPWENPTSLLYSRPSAVRDTFTPAMDKYISENIHGDVVPFSSFSYVAAPKRDELDLEGDATATGAHNNTAPLPLIPSVAILFRCCDVLVMTSDQYGFVKWAEYLTRIPKDATTIYILTEAAGYADCKNFPACRSIGKQLVQFLRKEFPNATVAIRRGHPNEAMVMMARAPVTICCASSFCLFPALSRSSGVTHLQHTPLLAQDQRVAISDHVKWIDANHESFRHPGGNNVINTDGFIKHVVNALKPH